MTINEIVKELDGIAAVCDGRPMDSRLANLLSSLSRELENVDASHKEEISRLINVRFNLGEGM
ncbi:hypothetical protein [Priestia megaterium]|uniref:hypothetical protein n=1 Tax=Priestia megaterium TaxID=1404 RepID=UPI003CC5F417